MSQSDAETTKQQKGNRTGVEFKKSVMKGSLGKFMKFSNPMRLDATTIKSSLSLPSLLNDTVKFLRNIIVLVLFVIVFYICYVIYKYGYPRWWHLGHSEPFENYMESYMHDLIGTMRKVGGYSSTIKAAAAPKDDEKDIDIDAEVAKASNAIKEIDDVYAKLQVALNKDEEPEKLDAKKVKKTYIPDFYLVFMFFDDLTGSVIDKDNLMYMNKFFPHAHVAGYYKEGGKTQLLPDKLAKLKDLADAFNKGRKAIAESANNLKLKHTKTEKEMEMIIEIFKLDMLMNLYVDGTVTNKGVHFRDNITRSYDLRKTGGLGNTIILRIYLWEYLEYIYHPTFGVIPEKWKLFWEDVNGKALAWYTSFGSDSTQAYVSSIPLKLAGMETFADVPDVIEHFGFLKPIIQTFIGLYKLVTGVVKVIKSPLGFFKAVIGLIIGVLLSVGYVILLAFGLVLFYPVAAAVVFLVKLYTTWVWIVLSVIMALVYGLLWLLDTLFDGAISNVLRCENLPNAWHTRPSFAKSNIFERSILCCRPCTSRYNPFGAMCAKKDSDEPSYCPQQLLYEVYNGNTAVLSAGKYVYEHTPSIKYYNMTKDERHAVWSETFDKKKAYLETCERGFGKYDHIPRAVCNMYSNQVLSDLSSIEKKQRANVMDMCEQTYCTRFIDQKNELPSWCAINAPTQEEAPADIVSEKPDVITNVILILIILILMIITFVGINNSAGTRPTGS
jgi:hypothetical protein